MQILQQSHYTAAQMVELHTVHTGQCNWSGYPTIINGRDYLIMTWAYTWAELLLSILYSSTILLHSVRRGPAVYCPVLWVLNCNMWCGRDTWQLQWWCHYLVTFIWANIICPQHHFSNFLLSSCCRFCIYLCGYPNNQTWNVLPYDTRICNLELQAKARFCTDSCTHAHCTNKQ